jgi:8-oxo-dGTP diphosphatase
VSPDSLAGSLAGCSEPGVIRVAAGVIRDCSGRILLSQRPAGKHLAGTWEFPGGKCDPDESASQALTRELDEELGIQVESAAPFLTLTHAYPERTVQLLLLEVGAYRGHAYGREGQALRWLEPTELDEIEMPAADRPIVKALSIDPHYAITPDPADLGGPCGLLKWAESAFAAGTRLMQLRAHSLKSAALADLAGRFGALARRYGAQWLLNGPPELALDLQADGIHLTGKSLAETGSRPLPEDRLIIASCHDRKDLVRAGRVGADLVCLSPVRRTSSHPDIAPLGWAGFEALIRHAPLPVFALGGVAPADLERARLHGAFGVAGISAFASR